MPDHPFAPHVDIEDLHPGAEVWSIDDHKVGRLHEVVVDASTDTITRIVVNAGPHFPMPGFGAPRLVSVPIEEVLESTQHSVRLRCSESNLDRFPVYAEWRGAFPVPTTGLVGGAGQVRYRSESEREITKGARVWRNRPHLYLGEVERVLMDNDTDAIIALVIRQGPLFGRDMLLPINFVADYADDVIHVQMTDAEIQSLQEFVPSED